MTKFEEELFNKVPCKFELTTEAEYKKTTLINHFKNWHSDDEYQELFEQNAELTRENNIVNQINSKLESQIADLKLQLQQQALPVVPEYVAEFIDESKGNLSLYGALFFICDNTNKELNNWVFREANQNLFARAWLDGYTVEKPQMFEVKMPIVYWDDDASQLTNGFEFLRIDKETDEVDFIGFLSNTKKHTVYFTEQEIKSIDERYWQFAVPVEDGE